MIIVMFVSSVQDSPQRRGEHKGTLDISGVTERPINDEYAPRLPCREWPDNVVGMVGAPTSVYVMTQW